MSVSPHGLSSSDTKIRHWAYRRPGVPVFSTAGDAAALRLDDREGLLSVRSAALQPGARQIEFDDDGPAFVATLNVLSLRMFYSEL